MTREQLKALEEKVRADMKRYGFRPQKKSLYVVCTESGKVFTVDRKPRRPRSDEVLDQDEEGRLWIIGKLVGDVTKLYKHRVLALRL